MKKEGKILKNLKPSFFRLYTKSGAWKKIPAPDFNFYMQKDKYPI